MPLTLPTDTRHLAPETRQYELFGKPLGDGWPRRKLTIGLAVWGGWIVFLLLLGMPLTWRISWPVYLFPPSVLFVLSTRVDDSGRMALMGWYDALLARLPSRRQVIRNPLLDLGGYNPEPIRIVAATTQLMPMTSLGAK
jgi:hypothetical protein